MKYTIIYDSLCGWCYGAHPLFVALAESRAEVTLLHRALFSGGGAHELSDFAARAWQADQKIAELSGQPFTASYKERVLENHTGVLNSWMTAVAAAIVRPQGPRAELALAARLQRARFVEGREAADTSVLVEALTHFGFRPGTAYAALVEDEAPRVSASRAREEAMRALSRAGRGGVPTILRDGEVFDLSRFYGKPDEFVAEIGS